MEKLISLLIVLAIAIVVLYFLFRKKKSKLRIVREESAPKKFKIQKTVKVEKIPNGHFLFRIIDERTIQVVGEVQKDILPFLQYIQSGLQNNRSLTDIVMSQRLKYSGRANISFGAAKGDNRLLSWSISKI